MHGRRHQSLAHAPPTPFLVHDAWDVSHFVHQPREGRPPDLPDANVERVFAVCVGATEEHDDAEDDVADEGEESGGDGAATVVGVVPARGTTIEYMSGRWRHTRVNLLN